MQITRRGGGDSVPVDLWVPQGVICETIPRDLFRLFTPSLTNTAASGTLRFAGPLTIPKGRTVHSLTVVSGSTALATGTHQWFCLVDQETFEIVAVTNDDGATGWAAKTPKTLPLAEYWTPAVDTAVWLGVCVVAATVPTFLSTGSITGLDATVQALLGLSPLIAGNSTTGLTTPPAVGTVVSAITASGGIWYGSASEAA